MPISDPHLSLDGEYAYVVTESFWAGTQVNSWLVTAAGLDEAKRKHGWTRAQHTTRKVRRARESDKHLKLRA